MISFLFKIYYPLHVINSVCGTYPKYAFIFFQILISILFIYTCDFITDMLCIHVYINVFYIT